MISLGVAVVIVAIGASSGPPSMLSTGAGQELATVAEAVRRAWAGQRAAGVVGRGSRVVLQLPGTGGSAGVGRDQAVRLLEALFRRSEELETRLVSSREVGPGQGYVELRRRYRLTGTGEERVQRVLLGFRRAVEGGAWELVELRVMDGDG